MENMRLAELDIMPCKGIKPNDQISCFAGNHCLSLPQMMFKLQLGASIIHFLVGWLVCLSVSPLANFGHGGE